MFRFNPYSLAVDAYSLGCQIKMSAELDGLVARLPEARS